MNRKAILVVSVLLAIALSMFAMTVATATVEPHPITVTGWAAIRTENGWVCGKATLSIIDVREIAPGHHDDYPFGVVISVRGTNFYWIIEKWCVRRSRVRIYAMPHDFTETPPLDPDGTSGPAKIRVTTCHCGSFWTRACGRGVYFKGWVD